MFETIFDKQLTRAFKLSDFYTSIEDWDGKKWMSKEDEKNAKEGKGFWKRVGEVFTGEPE